MLQTKITLAKTLYIDLQEYIYCVSPESCTFYLSFVDKVRSRKYVKNFFFRFPTLTSCCSFRRLLPPPLPDLCYRPACLHFSAEKGYVASSPRFCWAHMTSRRWIWHPLGPRAAVLSMAMKARLRQTTVSEWGQALGGLVRSCQGLESCSWGDWEVIHFTCVWGMVEWVYSQSSTVGKAAMCLFLSGMLFRLFESLAVLFFFLFGSCC